MTEQQVSHKWLVYFTPEHKRWIKAFVTRRYNPPREKRGATGMTPLDLALHGYIGEAAFSLRTHLPWSTRTFETVDGGWDFVLPDRRTVDVKYSRSPWAPLYFSPGIEFRADVAVLVVAGQPNVSPGEIPDMVWLRGWIGRRAFESEAAPITFGGYQCTGVPSRRLNAMEYLGL